MSYSPLYYQKNKEKILERSVKYYQKNKDFLLAKSKKRYKDNKEEISIKSKKYYQENKEKKQAQAKKYYLKNKKTYSENNKKYYLKNREKLLEKHKEYWWSHREKQIANNKIWRNKNIDKIRKKSRERYRENKDSALSYQKEYRKNPENREKIRRRVNIYNLTYRKLPHVKVAYSIRDRVRRALGKKRKTGSAVKDLGCSVDFLIKYIESLWQPGMSWENHSQKGWHIDHKKPIASFDLTDRKQFLEAVNYTNLQPLWSCDNLSKGAKIIN